ncbi:MAG: DNA gyrase subunit A, partial [Oscillospiraceae bacterium]|nr:DNA gyrase subunit A [Oscillospiraceae bacterium]
RKEPRVLPARFPNLLVNGSMGIAVGMTTNIPPHNMRETIDATICLIQNPEAELDDLMEHIKGPDFPTKGIIMGRVGIRHAYATGRGRVRVRARTEIEEYGQNRLRIIVTELPYQVNKARLLESIADLVKDKRLEGISGLRDESDRNGMRMVIELKRDANPQVMLNRLYSATQLQTTFSIVLLALVNDQRQPKLLNLKEILEEYITHQKIVITRRTEYDRRKAMERAHILEGLMIAVDNIDEVIKILRESYDEGEARLMARFGLSQIQAQAILDMRLRRIQGLEREKIEAEHKDLQEKIAYYNQLLADEEMLKGVLITELEEVRDKYGDERQTELAIDEDEIDIEDLIDEEDCVYTLTHAGYIKRLPADTYRSQRRGGKGITAQSLKDEDYVETVFTASTHDLILFFTSFGRVYQKKGYLIPEAGRTAKGTNIVNVLPLQTGEKVSAMIRVEEFAENEYLVFVTKGGTTKRLRLSALKNIRSIGIRAIRLDEEDELIAVRKTDGNQNILIATHDGMAICFNEQDVRPTGRDSTGVRGIRLRKGDYCVGAARAREGGALLTVTKNGYGKRTDILEYLRGDSGVPQNRGGVGLKNYNITEKTGTISGVLVVDDQDDILLISDDGTIIRMAAADISKLSRGTQGVRLMRVGEDAKVISIARTEPLEEEEIEDGEVPVGDAAPGTSSTDSAPAPEPTEHEAN